RLVGLGFFGTPRFVVLPQALRRMIQPLVNVFNGTVIGPALCSAVAVNVVTWVTQNLNNQYAEAVLIILVAGAVCLGTCLGGAALGGVLERAVSPDTPVGRSRDRSALDVTAGAQA